MTRQQPDAYLEEIEFLARHRFPPPVAGAVERLVSEPTVAGSRRAIRQAARETLRFLAAIHQAGRMASGALSYVAIPEPRALKSGFPASYFLRELGDLRRPTALLLALAGEPGGGLPQVPDHELSRERLLDALAELAAVHRYRLVIPGPWDKPYYKGAVVLLGCGLTFYGQALQGRVEGGDIEPGHPLLVDPRDGRILDMAPYLRWEPGRTPAEGTLFSLTGTNPEGGTYEEVGVVSARRLRLPLEGKPRLQRYPLLPGQSLALQHPPGRYQDGDRFDPHYLVHGLMWRGGVADVYRARLLDTGRPVVLKTFEGEADGENRGRFQDEIRFGRQVSHPNVVRIRPARHMPTHLIMEVEYAAGGNLADRLAVAGVLDPYETLEYVVDLCAALDAIHRAGVLHLDLKPENILFSADGELRLIDFGIAEALDAQPARLRPGYVVGTPGYVPPERQRGERLSVASDLWELGVLVAQMLTGVLPAGPDDLPSAPQLHPALRAVLARLVAPRPEDRPQSAAAALAGLKAAVAQVPPQRTVALDLEGTLLTTAYHPSPRPGLADFAAWALETFDRVFIYTAVAPDRAAEILEQFTRAGHLPAAFLARAEPVSWPRGDGGTLKDLRRLRLPLGWVVLVDDMASWVPPGQRHRWVRIAAYDDPRPGDRELEFIRPRILERFELG